MDTDCIRLFTQSQVTGAATSVVLYRVLGGMMGQDYCVFNSASKQFRTLTISFY